MLQILSGIFDLFKKSISSGVFSSAVGCSMYSINCIKKELQYILCFLDVSQSFRCSYFKISSVTGRKKRKQEKQLQSFLRYAQMQKIHIEIIYNIHHIMCQSPLEISFVDQKTKMPNHTILFPVPAIVETAMEALSRLIIYLFI